MTKQQLIETLKQMYEGAGRSPLAVHLFGIIYANDLNRVSEINDIANQATAPCTSYGTEIRKGIKLAGCGVKVCKSNEVYMKIMENVKLQP